MKILLVMDHSAFFPGIEPVVAELCERGEQVKVITRLGPKGNEEYQRFMHQSVSRYKHGSYEFSLRKRRDAWRHRIKRLRGLMDYAIYFRGQHTSPQLAARRRDRCPPAARRLIGTRAARIVVSRDEVLRSYRRAQALLPADRRIAKQIAAEKPDVVIGCPFISPMCWDLEYVRAAQKLGIPTASMIASWDYFSTKGTFHLMTDSVLVWNDRLAREAEIIHAVPSERIARCGAPVFDRYFGASPSLSRDRFCAQIGADPAHPYLLYLGSSEKIVGDEPEFVRDLARALRQEGRTAKLQIVVRPHPRNAHPWERFHHDGVTVFPRSADPPDLKEPLDDYVNTLGHAAAAMGINTTAFLEAAVAGLPCLTVVSDRHREGQVELGHFRHLLDSQFIETVSNLDALVAAMAEILDGNDRRAESRRRFVKSFLRPGGLERRAAETVAEAILATAAAGAARPYECGSHDGHPAPPQDPLAQRLPPYVHPSPARSGRR